MRAETIVVTSGKGGVGKSTVTANLGMAMARQGAKVCLVDADLGLRNLDLLLGLERRVVYDVMDVIGNDCRLEKALVHDHREPNLFFLPASQRFDKTALTTAAMGHLLDRLSASFDIILIDCPAGIEEGFQLATCAARSAVLVVNPEVSSVRDADRVLGLLNQSGFKDIRLIINRVRPEMMKRHDQIGVEDIQELLGLPILGVLADDETVITSTNRGEPLVLDRRSKLRKHFEQMADELIQAHLQPVTQMADTGLLGRLKALFA